MAAMRSILRSVRARVGCCVYVRVASAPGKSPERPGIVADRMCSEGRFHARCHVTPGAYAWADCSVDTATVPRERSRGWKRRRGHGGPRSMDNTPGERVLA